MTPRPRTVVEVTELWYRNVPGTAALDAPIIGCAQCLTYVGPFPGWPLCTANPKVTIRFSDGTVQTYCMSCYLVVLMEMSWSD